MLAEVNHPVAFAKGERVRVRKGLYRDKFATVIAYHPATTLRGLLLSLKFPPRITEAALGTYVLKLDGKWCKVLAQECDLEILPKLRF